MFQKFFLYKGNLALLNRKSEFSITIAVFSQLSSKQKFVSKFEKNTSLSHFLNLVYFVNNKGINMFVTFLLKTKLCFIQ